MCHFRFWTPGQAGNFYSPNPGGEELVSNSRIMSSSNQRSRGPGWSWPRMPWQRSDPQRFRQTPSSPDSQYGFSNHSNVPEGTILGQPPTGYTVISNPPYGIWGPPPPYSDPNSPARRGHYQYMHPSQCPPMNEQVISSPQPNLTVLECHQHSLATENHSIESYCPQTTTTPSNNPSHRSNVKRQNNFKSKENYENTPSDSDAGPRCGNTVDRFSNTLPARKTKKRLDCNGAKSIGPNHQSSAAQRINVQNVVFTNNSSSSSCNNSNNSNSNNGQQINHENNRSSNTNNMQSLTIENNHLFLNSEIKNSNIAQSSTHSKIRRIKSGGGGNISGGGGVICSDGVENSGFQSIENEEGKIIEPSESEVYFADVSSCCNMSVKNDNYYEETGSSSNNLRQSKMMKTENDSFPINATPSGTATSNSMKDDNEDYLVQRFGKRETSIRSRLPFPQLLSSTTTTTDDYDKMQLNIPHITPRTSLMQKDLSRQSMCSNESGEKTDYTDLSPATPASNYPLSHNIENYHRDFVASFPYSSNEQSQEAHRRSTKNIKDVIHITSSDSYDPKLHFDNIPLAHNHYDQDNSTMTLYNKQHHSHHQSIQNHQQYSQQQQPPQPNHTSQQLQQQPPPSHHQQQQHYHPNNKPKSPKNLNITPIKRQNLGTNITAIIQNLGGNDVGLLYPDNRRENSDIVDLEESMSSSSIQDCNVNQINNSINYQLNTNVADSTNNSCNSNTNTNIGNSNTNNNLINPLDDWPSLGNVLPNDRRL